MELERVDKMAGMSRYSLKSAQMKCVCWLEILETSVVSLLHNEREKLIDTIFIL